MYLLSVSTLTVSSVSSVPMKPQSNQTHLLQCNESTGLFLLHCLSTRAWFQYNRLAITDQVFTCVIDFNVYKPVVNKLVSKVNFWWTNLCLSVCCLAVSSSGKLKMLYLYSKNIKSWTLVVLISPLYTSVCLSSTVSFPWGGNCLNCCSVPVWTFSTAQC